MTMEPPRLGVRVLNHFAGRNEALAGDILEGFQLKQSRFWFWRELVAAIVTGAFWESDVRPLKLVEHPTWQPPLEDYSASRMKLQSLGLNGSGVNGIGGLTLIAIVFGISALQPAFWILLTLGPLFGALMALYLVRRGRSHVIGDATKLTKVVLRS